MAERSATSSGSGPGDVAEIVAAAGGVAVAEVVCRRGRHLAPPPQSLGAPAAARDIGLLDSACHRPATTVYGSDAYPSLMDGYDGPAARLVLAVADGRLRNVADIARALGSMVRAPR